MDEQQIDRRISQNARREQMIQRHIDRFTARLEKVQTEKVSLQAEKVKLKEPK